MWRSLKDRLYGVGTGTERQFYTCSSTAIQLSYSENRQTLAAGSVRVAKHDRPVPDGDRAEQDLRGQGNRSTYVDVASRNT